MYKRLLSVLLSITVLYTVTSTTILASTDAEKRIRFAEKARAEILKLGIGRDARISVKLRDKTKLAGYVSKAEEDHFVVTNLNTGESTTIPYAGVGQVKGNNLSTGAKVGIGVAIGIGILLLVFKDRINGH